MSDRSAALHDLHQGFIDSCEGYREAVASPGGAPLKALFEDILHRHEAMVDALAGHVAATGGDADDGPSLLGTFTQNIVSLRSAVGGDDGLLGGMLDGEKRLLDRCDAALAGVGGGDPAYDLLCRLYAEQAALVDALEGWKAAA